MKKQKYAIILTIIACLISFVIGRVLIKSWESASVIILILSIIYLIIGRFYKSAQIKELRSKQENYFAKVVIEDKEDFYFPIHICYFAGIYCLIIHLIVSFGFGIG